MTCTICEEHDHEYECDGCDRYICSRCADIGLHGGYYCLACSRRYHDAEEAKWQDARDEAAWEDSRKEAVEEPR